MELLRLRRRLDIARRGHKLLQDKLDELVREFLRLSHLQKALREEVEEKWIELLSFYLLARGEMDLTDIEAALVNPPGVVEIEKNEKVILNLRLTFLRMKEEKQLDLINYGMVNTTGDLDSSLKILEELMPKMLRLASIENAMVLVGEEIKNTRRKVNVLEYKMIPDLEETLSYIYLRLSEIERENFIRLIKVKEKIQK